MKPAPLILLVLAATALRAQNLLNLQFGPATGPLKEGRAATGIGTNDVWNRISIPPGSSPLTGTNLLQLPALRWADGSASPMALTFSNGPAAWGNHTGDALMDGFVHAPDGTSMSVVLTGVPPGFYNLYLYGHAAATDAPELNGAFTVGVGSNTPVRRSLSGGAWHRGSAWRDGAHVAIVHRLDIPAGAPLNILARPGASGVALLNGLQLETLGTRPPTPAAAAAERMPPETLTLAAITYSGRLEPGAASFHVEVDAHLSGNRTLSIPLFDGHPAISNPRLPEGWSLVAAGNGVRLVARKPGRHALAFDLRPIVGLSNEWRHIEIAGPAAAIMRVTVEPESPDAEVRLLTGTPATVATRGANPIRITGTPAPDGRLALQWRHAVREASTEPLVVSSSRTRTHLEPPVARSEQQVRLDVIRGRIDGGRLHLDGSPTVSRVQGPMVRDWRTLPSGTNTILEVAFARPVSGQTTLDWIQEEPLGGLPAEFRLRPPVLEGALRHSGTIDLPGPGATLAVDHGPDAVRQPASEPGLTSFQSSGPNDGLRIRLTPIEADIRVEDRVRITVEDHGATVRHFIEADIEKSGVHQLEFEVDPADTVSNVAAEGLESWRTENRRLRLHFRERLTGRKSMMIQLGRSWQELPPTFLFGAMRTTGAARESAWIGVQAAAGILLKTGGHTALRAVPARTLPSPGDEALGFRSDTGGWSLRIDTERPGGRLLADVFNLVTVGDGVVGCSATIRLAAIGQGVQRIQLRIPPHWRNVDITAPQVRRIDQTNQLWTIHLQDKVWGALGMVVTADFPVDSPLDPINAAGAHTVGTDQETGHVAVNAAPGVVLEPVVFQAPLHKADPADLPAADRALVTRRVLFAARHRGGEYALSLRRARHEDVPLLNAVADRTQLTSVLTPSGEMLTQAAFLVKNNEQPYQRFQLPQGAQLWTVSVNGLPARADADGRWILVPLPREMDRDKAIALDLKYAQQLGSLTGLRPRRLFLEAPRTDLASTYSEWEILVPGTLHSMRFGGSMDLLPGQRYDFADGWDRFIDVYRTLWQQHASLLLFATLGAAFLACAATLALKRGVRGLIQVIAVFSCLTMLVAMALPALSKAKSRAQRISSINNLKNIGLALRVHASDHGDGAMPPTLDVLRPALASDRILHDPESGQPYIYLGAGINPDQFPDRIIAHSVGKHGHREALLADGSVQQLTEAEFQERLDRQFQAPANRPATPDTASAPVPATTPSASPAPHPPGLQLPRAGNSLRFAKVLNLDGAPSTVEFSLVRTRVFIVVRSLLESVAFAAGIGLFLWQSRRTSPNRRWKAMGVALALIALADLLVTFHALHFALIIGVPAIFIGLLARFIHRHRTLLGSRIREFHAIPPAMPGLILAGSLPLLANTLHAAPAASPSAAPGATLVKAGYTGVIQGASGLVEAEWEFLVTDIQVPFQLLHSPDSLASLETFSGEVAPSRDEAGVHLSFASPGRATLKGTFTIPVRGDGARRHIDFRPPPALTSTWNVSIDDPDASVECPAAALIERSTRDRLTLARLVLGPGAPLNLAWAPRLRNPDATTANVAVTSTTFARIDRALLALSMDLECSLGAGGLRSLSLDIPPGCRVLRVHAPGLREWDSPRSAPARLTIELAEPATGVLPVHLELEQSLPLPPTALTLALPTVSGASRHSGRIGITVADDLGFEANPTAGLEQLDPTELDSPEGRAHPKPIAAWKFSRHGFVLNGTVDTLRPRIRVRAGHAIAVGFGGIRHRTRLEYDVSTMGIFSSSLRLPESHRIESVDSDELQGWSVEGSGAQRHIRIDWKRRLLGRAALTIRSTEDFTDTGGTRLEGIEPSEGDLQLTHVGIRAEPGLGLKTSRLEQLAEIPASDIDPALLGLPSSIGGQPALAFRGPAAPSTRTTWRIHLQVDRLPAWVRAETWHHVLVGEDTLSGTTRIRYEIQNAPVDAFRFTLPQPWRHVDVTAAGIRRQDTTPVPGGVEWTVQLQNRVEGTFDVTLHWEQPRTRSTNTIEIAGFQPVGVDRETGWISVTTGATGLRIPTPGPEGLRRIDASELPDWVRGDPRPGAALFTFTYGRPGWTLRLGVESFAEAALLRSVVEQALLRTVIDDDGQRITQLTFHVRDHGRQHLRLHLPQASRVWSAFVDGQAVRPVFQDGALLLPLDATGNGDRPATLELTYVGSGPFPRGGGTVTLESPRCEVPIQDARWEVYIPATYECRATSGTMTFHRADLVPLARDFTLGEYRNQESQRYQSKLTVDALAARQAREELSAGNVGAAQENLNRLRNRNDNRTASLTSVLALENDIHQRASHSWLESQSDYFLSNAGGPAGKPSNPPPAGQSFEGHRAVALRQIAQIQRSQNITTTHLKPLHVNLPTRGIRHLFTQALQADVQRPLTLSLHLRPGRGPGPATWTSLGLGAAACGVARLRRRHGKPLAQAPSTGVSESPR